jgi:hypothetical protein
LAVGAAATCNAAALPGMTDPTISVTALAGRAAEVARRRRYMGRDMDEKTKCG